MAGKPKCLDGWSAIRSDDSRQALTNGVRRQSSFNGFRAADGSPDPASADRPHGVFGDRLEDVRQGCLPTCQPTFPVATLRMSPAGLTRTPFDP